MLKTLCGCMSGIYPVTHTGPQCRLLGLKASGGISGFVCIHSLAAGLVTPAGWFLGAALVAP